MCFKAKQFLSLVIMLSLIFVGNATCMAKTKVMYTKKPYTVTIKNKKVIIPQYHKVKVRLVKREYKYVVENIIDFKNDNVNNSPFETMIKEDDIPKNSFPNINWQTKWILPKKTYVLIGKIKHEIKIEKLSYKLPISKVKRIPKNTFKSYMPYTAITSTGSSQYKLQRKKAYTDDNTGVRMVQGRYCVAVGPKVATKIGTKLDLIYKSGKIVPAIVADQKGNTIDGYRHPDGSAVEFVVDNKALPRCAKRAGDMSALKLFKGRITKIRVYKK